MDNIYFHYRIYFLIISSFVLHSAHPHAEAREITYDLLSKDDRGNTLKLLVNEDNIGRIVELYSYYINLEGKRVLHGAYLKYDYIRRVRTQSLFKHGEMTESNTEFVITEPIELLNKKRKPVKPETERQSKSNQH